VGDDRLGKIMDELPSFNVGDDGFSALGSESPIKKFANILPLPSALQTKLSNPGQLVTNFTAQRNLCQRNNLPDAVAGLVDNFCQLAANEPFRPLLNRVDAAVDGVKPAITTVQNALTTINGKVNDIIETVNAICSFFCSQK
jgi:hypothetical protein